MEPLPDALLPTAMPVGRVAPLREVLTVFGRLGLTVFGGPVAHVAAMEAELVHRRGWISRERFADLVGAASLIPGPNSTELAMHLGFVRAGWPGLYAAGVSFLLPAVAIVWGLAAAYAAVGVHPGVHAALAAVQPAMLAVVVQAIWRLHGTLVRSRRLALFAIMAFVASLVGIGELSILAGALLVGLLTRPTRSRLALLGPIAFLPTMPSAISTAVVALTPGAVFLHFAKIGAVLYGSGYVLLAFLRGEFVTRLGALPEHVLLDALAIGQVTPGPLFSTATFIGYQLAGHAGAAAATAGIFLPAFLAVTLTAPIVPRLRESARLASALDAVNAAALALMVSVVVTMGRGITPTVGSAAIFLVATLLLIRTRIGSGWVLAAAALAGWLRLV